jgi:hypothetical protein
MYMSSRALDLSGLPLWVFWLWAILGFICLVGAVLRILPSAVRKSSGYASALVGAVVFFGWAALSHGSHAVLWYGAVGSLLSALPILCMGRLPSDMPSAQDPAIREHPQFKKYERRGFAAGIAIALLLLAMVVLTEVFVEGVH